MSRLPPVSIVAAMASNRVIGRDGTTPWHLPDDLRRFRRLTLGRPVLMGRKTHESIGRPLPDRLNIVLTTNRDYSAPGCVVVHDWCEVADACADHPELMVIGGASVYAAALPWAQKLYLTLIHHDYPGDTWFPAYEESFRECCREDVDSDPEFPWPYSYLILERK
jgi:dihydrofolate reductase